MSPTEEALELADWILSQCPLVDAVITRIDLAYSIDSWSENQQP